MCVLNVILEFKFDAEPRCSGHFACATIHFGMNKFNWKATKAHRHTFNRFADALVGVDFEIHFFTHVFSFVFFYSKWKSINRCVCDALTILIWMCDIWRCCTARAFWDGTTRGKKHNNSKSSSHHLLFIWINSCGMIILVKIIMVRLVVITRYTHTHGVLCEVILCFLFRSYARWCDEKCFE